MTEITRGDILLANLGEGVGSEQSGERPVIVLQNNKGNKYSPTTIVAPISSRFNKKRYLPTHIPIKDNNLEKDSIVLLEQIRTIDKKRLSNKIIGHLSKKGMKKIEKAIDISLAMRKDR